MASNRAKKPLIYETYICTLTDRQKKFVEEEFFEVDEIRGQWMDELRQWAIRNTAIDWCRQDGLFLLRFLRYTKFARWCEAPVLAQEALTRYLAMRHIYPEWCRGLDPRGELMQKMIHDEIFTILGMDTAGQMIVWVRLGRFDVNNLDSIVLLRYMIMFLELMADHEPVQVSGIKVWVDYKGTSYKHFRYNFDLLREFKKVVEKAMPIWIREVHNVGLPSIAGSFRTFLCDLGTGLFKYKTFWHESPLDARIYFEKANWPEEYGGPCNATRQAGYLKRWFEEKRDLLMALDRMDINVSLDDIRFFKPYYGVPGKTDADVKVKLESTVKINCEIVKKEPKLEPMTPVKGEYPDAANIKSEFGKNNMKENVQPTEGTTKKEPGKKVCKCKKKKSAKAKVDTGRKGTAKKEAERTEANISKRETLPGGKSNVKKPWKPV